MWIQFQLFWSNFSHFILQYFSHMQTKEKSCWSSNKIFGFFSILQSFWRIIDDWNRLAFVGHFSLTSRGRRFSITLTCSVRIPSHLKYELVPKVKLYFSFLISPNWFCSAFSEKCGFVLDVLKINLHFATEII